MEWTIPQFSRSEVDKSGAGLLRVRPFGTDFQVVDNWRSAHNYPLNFFQNDLRRRSKLIDPASIVAQRIKRLSSITDKLRRFKSTRLSQMQDIGGCRAVVSDIQQVKLLAENYRTSKLQAGLQSDKDYIRFPKLDGYRAIHLVYRYAGAKNAFRGLKIEIQLRSSKQHAWATAVETVGLFTHQSFKSNRGHWKWRRFFASMGTAIAEMEDGCPVPNTAPHGSALKLLLRDYIEELDVANKLLAFEKALTELPFYETGGDHYFLLSFDSISTSLQVFGYKKNEIQKATEDYLEIERFNRGMDKNVVLVSVRSAADLRKAYPNYFLDTTAFLALMNEAIS